MIRLKHVLFLLMINLILNSCLQTRMTTNTAAEIPKTRLDKDNHRLNILVLKIMESMDLDDLAGQMIISYPDKDVIEMGIGGIILFHYHIKTEKHLQQLISSYNSLVRVPLFVMMDQEGGRVNNLKNLKKYKNMPSAQRLADWTDEQILEYNLTMGQYLNQLQINTVLAPCLDVSEQGSFMYKLQRSFSHQFNIVQQKGRVFARGLYEASVLTVGKHFPGYGNAVKNSDISLVSYKINKKDLARHLKVYQAAADYLDGIMMSNIIYEQIDSRPAVLSGKLVSQARKILPYGLIMTDDIQAKSIRDYMRQYIKENNLTIENETVIHSENMPNSWPFTVSEIKYTVEMAFNAGLTLFLTLDPKKAVFIKHYIKETALKNPANMRKLKQNVYLILRKKLEIYPQLQQEILALQ